MQTVPNLRHRRMHQMRPTRRRRRRSVLPQRRPCLGRSHQVTSCSPNQITTTNLTRTIRYLVYNLRKRGGDSADKYFKSTELIAGVKDMRFQALMPDVLHWLGITKIDNMVSMSDMFVLCPIFRFYDIQIKVSHRRKYNAIVQAGIPIIRRYDIPGKSNPRI
jgi:hypothetical protein